MKIEEFEKHNWNKDDKIYVIKTAFKNDVFIPIDIEEKHYLENPGYYQYIYDKVFLTIEDAKKGFVEESLRKRSAIKYKIANEFTKIDDINTYITQLKETELELKTKEAEYRID